MPLIRWEPWIKEREFFPLEVERWLDELTGDGWQISPMLSRFRKTVPEKAAVLVPRIDLFEEKDVLLAKVDIPGIEKENVTVTVEGERLTIKGSMKSGQEVKEKDYYYCERATGGFMRVIPLPTKVNADKVAATLHNGVLEIRLPKAEEAKGAGKTVTIT